MLRDRIFDNIYNYKSPEEVEHSPTQNRIFKSILAREEHATADATNEYFYRKQAERILKARKLTDPEKKAKLILSKPKLTLSQPKAYKALEGKKDSEPKISNSELLSKCLEILTRR